MADRPTAPGHAEGVPATEGGPVVDSGEARDPGLAGALNTLREELEGSDGATSARASDALARVETALADAEAREDMVLAFLGRIAHAAGELRDNESLSDRVARAVAAEALLKETENREDVATKIAGTAGL